MTHYDAVFADVYIRPNLCRVHNCVLFNDHMVADVQREKCNPVNNSST